MLHVSYYAQNYAGIIRQGLVSDSCVVTAGQLHISDDGSASTDKTLTPL